jgi:hypothetical protein
MRLKVLSAAEAAANTASAQAATTAAGILQQQEAVPKLASSWLMAMPTRTGHSIAPINASLQPKTLLQLQLLLVVVV